MNLNFNEAQWEHHAKTNKIIFSSCKDCVFFKSPDECSCGRLEKFTNISVDIVDDNNNIEYKVINGRICNMYRTGDWLKALNISEKPNSHLKKIARKEVQVKCSFVIICDDDDETRNEPRLPINVIKCKIKRKNIADCRNNAKHFIVCNRARRNNFSK